MTSHPNTRRSAAVAAVLALAAALVLAWSPAAGAHGGPGTLELVSATVTSDGGAIDITVRLTYAGDGDPVEDATVTVAGTGPRDVVLTPVTMEPIAPAGTYFATVAVPERGEWNLRVTSVEPAATLDVPAQQVGESTGGPVVVPTVGDQAVSPAAGQATTTTTAVAGSTTATSAEDSRGGGSNVWLSLLVGMAAGVVVIGLGALWRRRRGAGGQ